MERKLKKRQVSDKKTTPTAANVTEINQRYKERVRIPMIGIVSAIAPTGIATSGYGFFDND